MKAIAEVYYIPLKYFSMDFVLLLFGLCVTKWYNNEPVEQGPERKGMPPQLYDETGRHCVDENAHSHETRIVGICMHPFNTCQRANMN